MRTGDDRGRGAGFGGVLITCEHATNAVPRAYAAAFASSGAMLRSHRGWDPGAAELAQDLARALRAPLHLGRATRLLADLNRSVGHPSLFGPPVRGLSALERGRILAEHYAPYRTGVERAVAGLVPRRRNAPPLLHVSVHSFTPVLRGRRRTVDVGLLFDPRRAGEAALVDRWLPALAARVPRLNVRRNAPYRGWTDGLVTHLRTLHAPGRYVGIELEVNQRFPRRGGRAWATLRREIVASLVDVRGTPA